jgi:putative transposase
MANTFTQIHIQAVFAVQNRDCIISNSWKEELYKYMTGIFHNHNHKVLAINGMPDHIHIFFGMRPTIALSDLMQKAKSETTKWINDKGLVKSKFSWQEGYGAFSYSKSHVNNVIKYIHNQEEHHKVKSFKEEYIDFLKAFELPYEEKYLFTPVE